MLMLNAGTPSLIAVGTDLDIVKHTCQSCTALMPECRIVATQQNTNKQWLIVGG